MPTGHGRKCCGVLTSGESMLVFWDATPYERVDTYANILSAGLQVEALCSYRTLVSACKPAQ